MSPMQVNHTMTQLRAELELAQAEIERLRAESDISDALLADAKAERNELLAALQQLLSGHDNVYIAHFGPNSNPHDDIAAKPARAAIAKAKGGK
jgi:septal ring factor EnvC (AmiA/AmiB activator)